MISAASKIKRFFTSPRPERPEETTPSAHLEVAKSSTNGEAIDRLQSLLETIPTARDDINRWTEQSSEMIERLVVSKLSQSEIASILAGLVSYQKTGVTSGVSHQAFVGAFGNTSGLFQDILHRALFPYAPGNFESPTSLYFGKIDGEVRSKIVNELRDCGYCVLPFRLPAASTSRLNQAAQRMQLELLDRQSDEVPHLVDDLDPANPPRCGAACARTEDLATTAAFADLANDPLIMSIASEYLETAVSPIDSVLFYSFPSESPSSELAQLYHYDLDTIRWLKVFYYLSDVTEDTGPHAYVEGSHKPGAKAQELLDRGYVRISDSDMAEKQSGTVRTVIGPAGTVILGDTRAFHKGHRVRQGHRLIFSPIYAASKVSYVQGRKEPAPV